MNLTKSSLKTFGNSQPVFLVVIILCFTFLFFRNSGLYPLVVDEYFYNKFSRLAPFSEAYYPNYLFYAIYKAVNICGDGFLGCVQFLNCGFYVLALIPIYRISLTVCTPKVSFVIALISILSPFNYFTAFFMTEAVFFLAFWSLVWIILCAHPLKDYMARKWLWVGFLLGCASLIKINGLLLLPAICLYLIYEVLLVSKSNVKQVVINCLMLFGGLFIVKFGISLILVGRSGLTLGGIYSGAFAHVANEIISAPSIAGIDNPSFSLWNSIGHKILFFSELAKILLVNLIPIGYIFGIPVANILTFFRAYKAQYPVGSPQLNLYVLSIFMLINLLLSTVAFSWVATHFGGEKLHAMRRYYELAYPLFLIIIGGSLAKPASATTVFRCGISLIICVINIVALSGVLGDIYWHSDWFSSNQALLYLWAALLFLALALWTYSEELGNKFYLFLVVPLVVFVTNWGIFQSLQQSRINPNEFDRAGLFVRHHLSQDDLNRLTIVSASQNLMGLFFLDNHNIEIQTIPAGNKYKLSQLPAGKDWILLLDNLELDNEGADLTHMDYISLGYATLFGGHGLIDIDLSNRGRQDNIKYNEGLSAESENWGTWSEGNKIVLAFSKPLPRKFNLIIDARAFGPNVGKPFTVILGDESHTFTLKDDFERRIIPVFNPKKLNSFVMTIPAPASPLEMGIGDDNRKIGIGIKKIQVQW